MNIYFTFIIIFLITTCLILFTKYKLEKGKNEHLLIVNKCSNNLIIENQNLKDELLKLKEKNFSDKEEAFNRGMENGKKNYNYEVQIHPYQEVFKNKKML